MTGVKLDPDTGERIRKVWRNDGRGNYLARHMPGHPLASKSGRCLAHRASLFEKLGGADADCAWCQRPLTWAISPPSSELIDGRAALTCDHLDGNVRNNLPGNLVPSCLGCNSRRRVKPRIPPTPKSPR